jgi:hypothetical protein
MDWDKKAAAALIKIQKAPKASPKDIFLTFSLLDYYSIGYPF